MTSADLPQTESHREIQQRRQDCITKLHRLQSDLKEAERTEALTQAAEDLRAVSHFLRLRLFPSLLTQHTSFSEIFYPHDGFHIGNLSLLEHILSLKPCTDLTHHPALRIQPLHPATLLHPYLLRRPDLLHPHLLRRPRSSLPTPRIQQPPPPTLLDPRLLSRRRSPPRPRRVEHLRRRHRSRRRAPCPSPRPRRLAGQTTRQRS